MREVPPKDAPNREQYYAHFDRKKFDIQIMLSLPRPENKVAHFLTLLYNPFKNVVVIYESYWKPYRLEKDLNLSFQIQKIIDIRYGTSVRVALPEPRRNQPDNYSCSIYAAAAATALIKGENPAKTLFYNAPPSSSGEDLTLRLRRHMAYLIQNNILELFPGEYDY